MCLSQLKCRFFYFHKFRNYNRVSEQLISKVRDPRQNDITFLRPPAMSHKKQFIRILDR